MSDDSVNDFLAHYGVRGMKWGQRKREQKLADKTSRRDIMKDKNLDEIVDRRRKEKELKKLLDEDLNPYRTSTKKFVDDFIKDNGGKTIGTTAFAAVSIAAGAAFMAIRINQKFSDISISPIPLR